jgi:GNAT superfamily N-acetyltransferase
MEITIRPIGYLDWRPLAQIMTRVFPEITNDLISHFLCVQPHTIGIAVMDRKIIGFYQFNQSKSAHTAWLNYIGVLDDRWRKGIGSRLLRDFEKRACNMGYTKVDLYVRLENLAAQRFYHNNGYRCMGIRRGMPDSNCLFTKDIAATSALPQAATPSDGKQFLTRINRRLAYTLLVKFPGAIDLLKQRTAGHRHHTL